MRRRDLIAGLGGATVWPFLGMAQPASMPVIGFLDNSSPDPSFRAAFIEGLSQSGYDDGRNVASRSTLATTSGTRRARAAASVSCATSPAKSNDRDRGSVCTVRRSCSCTWGSHREVTTCLK
jgi:hypothetical protein